MKLNATNAKFYRNSSITRNRKWSEKHVRQYHSVRCMWSKLIEQNVRTVLQNALDTQYLTSGL